MVSGGFDPLHIGHVRLLREAKKLGDRLVVVINNDNWLKRKGKHEIFMPENERKEILEAIEVVDEVIISRHEEGTENMSVSEELERIKPDIFANGGDRDETDANNPASSLHKDIHTCKRLGIEIVYNVGHGGKVRSSSDLLKTYLDKAKKKNTA